MHGRAGLAKRAQTPPLTNFLTSARDATSAPSRAQVRATPGGALSPPPPEASPGGAGHSLSGCGMLNERGGLKQPFSPSPLPLGGTTGQGGAHGEGLQASRALAGRLDGHTRVGGYNRVLTPPPSRGLADILGDISRRLTAARAGSLAIGEGIDPPPRVGGGGEEQGTLVDPHPHPSGGGAQGVEAATSAAQVELDQPSPPPPGPCRGNQGSFSPPPPHKKG